MRTLMKSFPVFMILISIFLNFGQTLNAQHINNVYYQDSKPWTRYWWFASLIQKEDIRDNLQWLKAHGFGGVEIAWVYPLNRMQKDTVNYTPRQEWHSKEWTDIVTWTKKCADSMGMGCDFTFGTLWPFGDSKVPLKESSKYFGKPDFRDQITASWEYPVKGLVINHLDKNAFRHYAERMGNALKPAFQGNPSAIFVDSWEVESRWLWTDSFDVRFKKIYGYDIVPFMDHLYEEEYGQERYDYMKLLSQLVIDEFYTPFTQKAHELGGFSRGQCSGAPCDIISAYSRLDVPEGEALLYEPSFSNFVASAAALSSKTTVSAETFTCLYGWPRDHHSEEQMADLKLLADALFANGINHIFWHGKPHNPAGQDTVKFYASVHVGASGSLASQTSSFNAYMQKISAYMKKGHTCSQIAVYAPFEDAWIQGEMPVEQQFKWAWGAYEMRYVYLPEVLKGYRPLWINTEFLEKSQFRDGVLHAGEVEFRGLYINVNYLDLSALQIIYKLARKGLTVCLNQRPLEAGKIKHAEFDDLMNKLYALPNVSGDLNAFNGIEPMVTGDELPDFWVRKEKDKYYFFFAHPKAGKLKFPMGYGESYINEEVRKTITISINGKKKEVLLTFPPYQSLLVKADSKGHFDMIDITFIPETPKVLPRIKKDRELWEVEK